MATFIPLKPKKTHPPLIGKKKEIIIERETGDIAFWSSTPNRVENWMGFTLCLIDKQPYLEFHIQDCFRAPYLDRYAYFPLSLCDSVNVETGEFSSGDGTLSETAKRWEESINVKPKTYNTKGGKRYTKQRFISIQLEGLNPKKLDWWGHRKEDMSLPVRDFLDWFHTTPEAMDWEALVLLPMNRNVSGLDEYIKICGQLESSTASPPEAGGYGGTPWTSNDDEVLFGEEVYVWDWKQLARKCTEMAERSRTGASVDEVAGFVAHLRHHARIMDNWVNERLWEED